MYLLDMLVILNFECTKGGSEPGPDQAARSKCSTDDKLTPIIANGQFLEWQP